MSIVTKTKNRFNVFLQYSDLLRDLVARDIKIKYRGSFLGLVWSVLNPLLMMVVMTIVFNQIFKSQIDFFPIYYLAGYMVFNLNTEGTTDAMYSITGNASLLKKVYVPKYLFPLSKLLTAMVNALFTIAAMLIIMIFLGVPFRPTLILLPLLLVYVFIFSLGIGLFMSAVSVLFKDLTYLYNVFIYAWTFLTPIFYPMDSMGELFQTLMNFNPMYHYISFSRNIVLYGVWPSFTLHFFCILFGVVTCCIGVPVFYKLQDKFILHI